MMLRGTRLLQGAEATRYATMSQWLRVCLERRGYSEVVVPNLWEAETFGDRDPTKMWTFKDKGDRNVCLIPEVTKCLVEQGVKGNVFYISRCYRYDRPQLGRYREFTQVGVEALGTGRDTVPDLRGCLDSLGLKYRYVSKVQRGLSYYTEDGFEVECDCLGAQKQVAGGGRMSGVLGGRLVSNVSC